MKRSSLCNLAVLESFISFFFSFSHTLIRLLKSETRLQNFRSKVVRIKFMTIYLYNLRRWNFYTNIAINYKQLGINVIIRYRILKKFVILTFTRNL